MARTPRAVATKAAVDAGAASVPADSITHYKVTVSEPFLLHQVLFRPGEQYTVSKRVYEGQLSDSRYFKDLCIAAKPVQTKGALP